MSKNTAKTWPPFKICYECISLPGNEAQNKGKYTASKLSIHEVLLIIVYMEIAIKISHSPNMEYEKRIFA